MSRLNSRRRKIIYEMLAKRDREICQWCKKPGNSKTLVVDHVDNNRENNSESNFQLLCRSHNNMKNPRGPGRKKSPERERKIEDLNLKECSAEFAKSERCRPIFNQWLFDKIMAQGMMKWDVLVDGGAAKIDGSQQTVTRYLKSATSIEGKYERIEVEGVVYVQFKPEYAAQLKREEDKAKNVSGKVLPMPPQSQQAI